jgi:hypothetical protein
MDAGSGSHANPAQERFPSPEQEVMNTQKVFGLGLGLENENV